MRVVIELKTVDADGFGGKILKKMGFKRDAGDVFHRMVLPEADDDVTDPSLLVRPYIEALKDHGVSPRRVNTEIRDVGTVNVASVSPQASTRQVVAALRAAAAVLAGRETRADGSWVPQLGDKVYMLARGFGGSGGSIHGVVVKGSGGLRVKLTGYNGAMPSTDVHAGKTMPLTDAWFCVDDPMHARRDAAKQDAANSKDEIKRLAEEAIERYAEKHRLVRLHRPGDVEAGDEVFMLTSAGRWGSGDPEKVSMTTETVSDVTNRDFVFTDAEGIERTSGDVKFWWRKR